MPQPQFHNEELVAVSVTCLPMPSGFNEPYERPPEESIWLTAGLHVAGNRVPDHPIYDQLIEDRAAFADVPVITKKPSRFQGQTKRMLFEAARSFGYGTMYKNTTVAKLTAWLEANAR